jgi:hypothetical protein
VVLGGRHGLQLRLNDQWISKRVQVGLNKVGFGQESNPEDRQQHDRFAGAKAPGYYQNTQPRLR